MRVILDTNVIIAAFASKGLCHSVFTLCIDRCEIILSPDILQEVRSNLSRKIKLTNEIVENVIDYLYNNSIITEIDDLNIQVCRDPDDDKILELAVKTQPDFIITGDDDLLSLKEFESIKIINPREFWEIVRDKDNIV